MNIEIDQSGKLENTEIDTVVAFSNTINKSIKLSAKDKRAVQRLCRSKGKPKVYVYKTFSILIYLLIKPYIKKISQIVIDNEYNGWAHQIKDYILTEIFKNSDFDKKSISFCSIGRKSNAHYVAHTTFQKINKPDFAADANKVAKLI